MSPKQPERVRVRDPFRYSADGRTSELKVPNEVFDCRGELVLGLLGEGVIEQTDERPTPPEELERLREEHSIRSAADALAESRAAAEERRAAAEERRAAVAAKRGPVPSTKRATVP